MTLERKAIEVLQNRGLAKGILEDGEGRMCAIGALSFALCGDARSPLCYWNPELWEVACRASRIANEQYPERRPASGYFSLAAFNDHPDTTQEDVERVLAKSAIGAEEQI
jgi:hypothetical protein